MKNKSLISLFVLAGLILIMLTGCVTSDVAYKAGVQAYAIGDESTAYSEFRKAADEGHPEAQWFLSGIYREGKGVEKNLSESERYARMAADKGFAPSQLDIDMMYYTGRYLEQDYTKAIYWLRKSAEQDYPQALFFLGMSYAMGAGVERNVPQAVRYFQLANEKGLPVIDKLLTQEGVAMIKPIPDS